MISVEMTLRTETIYKGRIISVERQTVELQNGKKGTREIVRHQGAAAVIPLDEKGYVYTVKQYRKPFEKIMTEIPAGKLDEGETPETCAARELAEETGLKAGKLTRILTLATTPGFCDEVIHVFLATDLVEGKSNTDEDEFLMTERIHMDRLCEMILDGSITDAKTIAAVLAVKILKSEAKINESI